MSKARVVGKHFKHYIPLYILLMMGVLGFITFSYDRVFQIVLAALVAIGYVAWGLIHHYLHDDLDLLVVVEYLVIATLGLVIVYTILFRA